MSREFWAIIGVGITLGLGLGSLIVTQHASINFRLDSMGEDIGGLRERTAIVETRLGTVESNTEIVRADILSLRNDVSYLIRLHVESEANP